MNKMLKISLLLLITIVLCSCTNKKEYNLVELTAEELVENITSEENKNFVFAIYNSQTTNGDEFLKSLQNVVNNAKLDIYYIDYYHIDTESGGYFFDIGLEGYNQNGYYAFINGEMTISAIYIDFKTLYTNLKDIGYQTEITKFSQEQKVKYIEEAKKLYDEGLIALSFDELNKAWDLKEAKDMYNDYKYYNILNSWETYEAKDEKMEKINYKSLLFYHGIKYFYYINRENVEYANFEKPNNREEYEQLYYYIKDDIIYSSKSESGKYKKIYQIIYIDNTHLNVMDVSNKKEYEFVRRT